MQTASPPDAALAEAEARFGMGLGAGYRRLHAIHGGHAVGEHAVGERAVFYAAGELAERNAYYQAREYCPGFLAIGDDGGGRAVVIAPQLPAPPVFAVDQGDMTPETFELLSPDLGVWLDRGCPLHDQEAAA